MLSRWEGVSHRCVRGSNLVSILLAILVLVPLLGCGRSGVSAETAVGTIKPTVTLRWADIQNVRSAAEIGDQETMTVAFLDGSHLVIGGLFQSSADPNAGRDFRETIRRIAVVAVVNAKTGQVEASKTWGPMAGQPAFADKMNLLPTATGDSLVGIGNKLYLMSAGLKQLAERDLPLNKVERNGYPYQDMWFIKVAPARKTALLIRTTPDYNAENHWLDLRTLKDHDVSPAPKYSSVALADDESIFFNDNGTDVDNVQILPRGTSRRALCPTCVGAVTSSFGKDLVLLSTKPAASYLVADTAGKVLLASTHGKNPEFVGPLVGAASVNRVAFQYGHLAGARAVTHFTVLDADAKKEVWDYELSLEPRKLGNMGLQFTTPRVALSPDGHKLAIMTSDTLEVFDIP